MTHLNGGDYCSACEQLLNDGHPGLRIWFRLARAEFPTLHVGCVWRGQEEQEKLVKHRASYDAWPLSPHNRIVRGKRESLAMDLFNFDGDRVRMDTPYLLRVANHLEDIDAPIDWGGDDLENRRVEHFALRLPLRLV